MDDFLLSRIQFAANISFHILFPTITIALGWLLVFFKWRYQRTRQDHWMELYFFFTKVFALSFGLGVVSGLTMSFQFGTNWPGFMNTVGNIAGPLLAYEVLTAFFLEATFLGIMLYAFRRVPGWVHTSATVLVAIGTTLSAFWILVLNSWMHTPQGFAMVDGVAQATDWWAIVFTPSLPYRLAHTLLSSALTAAFLVAGLLAWRWLRGDRGPAVRSGLATAVALAALVAPLQALVGDLHGVNTRDHQPAKLAAMEGLWETTAGAPLVLFALPDEQQRENHYEIAIPKLGSLIATRDPNGVLRGLDEFPDAHPPVAPVFWAFRIMVGVGVLMMAVGAAGAWLLWRRRTWPSWYMRTLAWMTFSGWVATLAGWYVTEIGRQPWLVQGVLRTRDAVAELPPASVGFTLALYLATYAVLLVAYLGTLRYLVRHAAEAAQAPALATETKP
jgi:cytochrome d ubiquinol oxidase subunit I